MKKQEKTSFLNLYKNYIFAGVSLVFALIFVFAFAKSAGTIGNSLEVFFRYLFGGAVYAVPIVFLLATILLLWKNNPYLKKEKYSIQNIADTPRHTKLLFLHS